MEDNKNQPIIVNNYLLCVIVSSIACVLFTAILHWLGWITTDVPTIYIILIAFIGPLVIGHLFWIIMLFFIWITHLLS